MNQSYRGILHGNHIEWTGPRPESAGPVEVEVVLLAAMATRQQSDGKTMAEALRAIADAGGPAIDDPVAWQRELRKDRPLPFRQDA